MQVREKEKDEDKVQEDLQSPTTKKSWTRSPAQLLARPDGHEFGLLQGSIAQPLDASVASSSVWNVGTRLGSWVRYEKYGRRSGILDRFAPHGDGRVCTSEPSTGVTVGACPWTGRE